MFLDNQNFKVPRLGFLAGQAVLKDSELALKNYKNSSLHQYSSQVAQMNQSDLIRVRNFLEGLEFPEKVSIYTTGSDGRLEKTCRSESPIEFIMVCDSEERPAAEEKIATLIQSGLFPIDNLIEWRDPNDSLIDCNCYKTKVIIPSRFLHHIQLIGSNEQRDELTEKFIADLARMNNKIRSKFRKKFVVQHAKKLAAVLAGEETADVNLAAGKIFFSGAGDKGTKHSLLRPIQYSLDLVLVDAIRNKKITPQLFSQMFKDMPRGVVDQIDFIYQNGLLPQLSKEDIEDLKKAYILGLFYFQTAQHLFASQGKPIEFSIPDKEEFAKAYQDTARILAKLNPSK